MSFGLGTWNKHNYKKVTEKVFTLLGDFFGK